MKNIQAQYKDLMEGKMSNANFMRNIRMQFPQHISPTTSFEDSIKILKNKQLLFESQIQELSPELKLRARDKARDKFQQAYKDNPNSVASHKAEDQYHTISRHTDPELMSAVKKFADSINYDFRFLRGIPDQLEIDFFQKGKDRRSKGSFTLKADANTDKIVVPRGGTNLDKATISKLQKVISIFREKQVPKQDNLNEAKEPIGVYGHNPNAENDLYRGIDHVNYYQMYHGLQYELSKMPEITDEAYIKARKKVVDNILKNPDAYKDLQLANFKAVKEMDKDLEMKEVKEGNHVDKPNEMKVVKKDVKGNTEDTLGKKEAKKAKNGKGLEHMTQNPKGKLEAFATPGKEKVQALKEHIIDEMSMQNPHHEGIRKGSRVKKKGTETYSEAEVGNVEDFDGDTATVKWDNEKTEHVQLNVLTQKSIPEASKQPISHGDLTVNSRVKKTGIETYDPAQVGNVKQFNVAKKTAIVKWDNGAEEEMQIQDLTKQNIPAPSKPSAASKLPDLGQAWAKWNPKGSQMEESKESKIKRIKERLKKVLKKETIFKKGSQQVVASTPQSIQALTRSGYREVPNTRDVTGLAE